MVVMVRSMLPSQWLTVMVLVASISAGSSIPVLTKILPSSSSSTFGLCEGHCHHNAECAGGLLCVPRLFEEAVPGCADADPSAPLTGINVCIPNPTVLQVFDESAWVVKYPNQPFPRLGMCQGDCDNNGQCLPGYKCHLRGKLDPVPGCAGGESFNARTDFCILDENWVPPTPAPAMGGDNNGGDVSGSSGIGGNKSSVNTMLPSLVSKGGSPPQLNADPKERLGLCEGDCDSDDDCEGQMICFMRDSNEDVTGCDGGLSDDSPTDYCINPTVKPSLVSKGGSPPQLNADPKVRLGLCEGDCDSDDDCEGQMICFMRDANEDVPECEGGMSDDSPTDYCVYPADVPPLGNENVDPPANTKGGVNGGGISEAETTPLPLVTKGGEPPQLDAEPKVRLGRCEGDCDSDDDCDGHMICFMRDGSEEVLGCEGGVMDDSPTDYCVYPTVKSFGDVPPRSRYPLQACEGDCDADVDCATGLVCMTSRVGGQAVPGCLGGEDDLSMTSFCVPGIEAPTVAPYSLPTLAPGSAELLYVPGKLTVNKNQLMLSQGLDVRLLAEGGLPVEYGDGSLSDILFHRRPDGAATFPNPDGSGGFVYVSNSEEPDNGKGGVGAIYFDKDGKVVDYKMILTGTTMNCAGGRTHWNTWVSNEELHKAGQVWQVDPYDSRPPQATQVGRDRGAWESFAYDMDRMEFYSTEDQPDGALVRFRPDPTLVDLVNDPWNALHVDGVVDYLVLTPNPGDTQSGTFGWTTDRSVAKASAVAYYPNTEGIDVRKGIMYFVCKRIRFIFTLDLSAGTWTSKSTRRGLFDGGPDQMQRIVGDTRDMLYFTEEQDIYAGIHARDSLGRFYVIVESHELPGETTGLAFSPDGRFVFVAYQDTGKLFMIWRRDGKPFQADRLDVKFHHVPEDIGQA